MAKSNVMNLDVHALEVTPDVMAQNLLKVPYDIPVTILGSPGIGKTMIVGEVAKKAGARLLPKLCTTMEAVDVSGIPFPVGEVTEWKYPNFLWAASTKAENQSPLWLFLDEITSATEDVQKAFLKWIHERTDGVLTMRDNVRWILAGNHSTDRVGASDMIKTLSSRCVTMFVRPDADAFCNWGRSDGGIHPWVIGWIRTHPNHIMTFNPDSSEPAFACPRSYENVSKIIHMNKDKIDDLFQIVAGTIGMGIATEFFAYVRQAEKCIPPEDICKDPENAPIPETKDIDILHATVAALESYIKKNPRSTWRAGFVYSGRIQPELGILLARHVLSIIINDLKDKDRIEAVSSKEFFTIKEKWKQYFVTPTK